ncbi:MAG: hypothetical protein M1839_000828 [Geoglossum umbratile]|nr:MAG: hypothetical protein M1839_000828 [Geoglossum umbratile]
MRISSELPLVHLSFPVPKLSLMFLLTANPIILDSVNNTLALIGVALFSASTISAIRNSLDLFHALCVLHLLGLCLPSWRHRPDSDLGVISDFSEGRYDWFNTAGPNANVDAARQFFSQFWPPTCALAIGGLHFLSFAAFLIALNDFLGDPQNFGPNPECNSQIRLAVFGIAVPATAPVIPWIASILLIAELLVAAFQSIQRMGMNLIYPGVQNILRLIDTASDSISDPTDHLIVSQFMQMSIADGRPFGFAAGVLARVYCVVAVESMLLQNSIKPGPGVRMTPWQVLVIIATVVSLLLGCILPCGLGVEEREGDIVEGLEMPQNNWEKLTESTSKFGIFIVTSLLDLGWNALAGVLAALAGASASGSVATRNVLQLGALAGVIKSGMSSFAVLSSRATVNDAALAVIHVAATFTIPFIVTSFIAQRALHQVPNALTTAALATSAPLLFSNTLYTLPVVQQPLLYTLFQLTGRIPMGRLPISLSIECFLLTIGFDALSGFTFARVARNHGYTAIKENAAAGAGAVFGVTIYVANLYGRFLAATRDEIRSWRRDRRRNRRLRRRRGRRYGTL